MGCGESIKIRKRGDKYVVMRRNKVLGTHPTRKAALQQLRAIYANADLKEEGKTTWEELDELTYAKENDTSWLDESIHIVAEINDDYLNEFSDLNMRRSMNEQSDVDRERIEKWLRQMKIKNWTYNDKNGTIDVNGNVNLYGKGLTKIPVRFGEVTGYFNCAANKLFSLKGSPKKVGNGFYCVDNMLIDLKGGPVEVKGDYDCSNNQLLTLKGAPSIITGNFNCDNNQLTNLIGAPNIVMGDFSCTNNDEFVSLKGSLKKVYGDFIYTFYTENGTQFTEEDIKNVCEVHGKIIGI